MASDDPTPLPIQIDTMVRTTIAIDDNVFALSQNTAVDDLKRRIESAVTAGGRFVDFGIVGNREVSVLVTSTTRVSISVERVPFDHRDTGDLDTPFGGLYDF